MKENEIAKINDRFRASLGLSAFTGGVPGRLAMTAGIACLPPDHWTTILEKVREFSEFTEDDIYDEHDFGAFAYAGDRIFWKIEYYAPDMRHGSENPADLSKTVRVLTIMFASEY